VHRQYEHLLGPAVDEAKQHLPPDFEYTVVKHQARAGRISFIHSPDFDTAPEPIVGLVVTVSANGTARIRYPPDDPFIYHHKWLFVSDDYPGFDVVESKARSCAWAVLPDVDRMRIGRMSYWQKTVVPHLEK